MAIKYDMKLSDFTNAEIQDTIEALSSIKFPVTVVSFLTKLKQYSDTGSIAKVLEKAVADGICDDALAKKIFSSVSTEIRASV